MGDGLADNNIAMEIFGLVFELLFYSVCGWVGHHFVKLATFGKVELEWESGSEAVITAAIGALVLISGAMLLFWLL